MMIWRCSTRFQLNLVVDFTFNWHARGFEHIGVLSDQVGPTRRWYYVWPYLSCTSTHAHLHGIFMACGLQQHQPRLTTLSHVTLKLLDTTQLDSSDWRSGPCMQGNSTLVLCTLHRHGTNLPINDWVCSPQPIDTQCNFMIQTRDNTTSNNSMQCNAPVSTDNQRYQAHR